MKWLRKGAYNTVKELVQANTGMSANDLAYDARRYHYPGIKEAAELFMDHIKHGSKILVWCDYDTDGVDCKFIMSYTKDFNIADLLHELYPCASNEDPQY